MKIKTGAILCSLLLVSAVGAIHAQDDSTGTVKLFDGSNLDHWLLASGSTWRVVDGVLVSDGGPGNHLVSRGAWGDFDVSLEFWIDEPGNSGVFIRCADLEAISSRNCYEVNIYDLREDPTYRSGAIVNVAAPLAKIDTIDHWNTYRIRAQGNHLQVWLNGTLTVDAMDDAHSQGHLTLQYGGAGVVKFRNISLMPL